MDLLNLPLTDLLCLLQLAFLLFLLIQAAREYRRTCREVAHWRERLAENQAIAQDLERHAQEWKAFMEDIKRETAEMKKWPRHLEQQHPTQP